MPPATPDFAAIRAEFALPQEFPPEVLVEAERAAARGPAGERVDATDLPLVTIDPPGSKDLDQALGVVRTATGYRVHYAIADVGSFVRPGGALDAEVRRRGQTVYLPDGSVPLHPPTLSERAASLLPDGPRPAVLWTVELDGAAEPVSVDVRRALVRSAARLDYEGVQADFDAGRLHPALAGLPELGRMRRALALGRGAIELEMPEQEVVPDGAGWTVRVRARSAVEQWNEQVSLLTGASAAGIMIEAGVGLLRTLPAPDPEALAGFRRTAEELGVAWPDGAHPAEVLAGLPPSGAVPLAVRRAATALLRGARYTAFDTAAGVPVPEDPGHGGIGSTYAHVTAPLRRLVDRFGSELCLALAAGQEPPDWLRAALPALPEVMAASDALAGKVGRACVDRTEAGLLVGRIGERFEVVVLRAGGPEGEPGEVFLADPPVVARCAGAPRAGRTALVRLTAADPGTGRIEFAAGDAPASGAAPTA
ncbi:RNB domain-containing ribonuclease [Pseudonocardia sp. S2-4]|uniref:RNB domain-containing ribonuclease n=1 Tax=Pseudonocardia humida TaxID=2800819 RepID=A0ABT1A5T8_9PSEU|nr:RNB domain-containing ribonuclease [Pseudonocardia humida]